MNNYMDMTKPCPKCPFRSDIPGYLRRSRVREIQHHLTTGDGRFTCHETTVPLDDGSGEMWDGPNAKHCAGAMILLHKTGHYNQMMRIAARLLCMNSAPDPDNPLGLDLDAPVYASFAAMIRAQPR